MSEINAVRIHRIILVMLFSGSLCEHSFKLAHPKAITESRTKFNYIPII